MKRFDLGFLALQIPLDVLALLGASSMAYMLRFTRLAVAVRPVVFSLSFDAFFQLSMVYAAITVAVFLLSGVYAAFPRRSVLGEVRRVVGSMFVSMAIVFTLAFFSRTLFDSRFILLAAFIFSIVLLLTVRMLTRGLQVVLRQYFGLGCTPMAIIGNASAAEMFAQLFADHPGLGFTVVAHETKFSAKQLLRVKRERGLQALLFAATHAPENEVMAAKTFSDTEHVSFFYSADLFPASTLRPIIHNFGGMPLIEVPKTPLDGWGAIYKRSMDIFGALVLIVLSLPLQLLVAVALFVEQPGAVLFARLPDGKRTMRMGQHGQAFWFFKFRSMVKNAHQYRFDPDFIAKYGNEREGTPLFKLSNDPRVTRVGKFIRAFSLDELPEFFLVLIGKMSLVGPRPHLPEEVADYTPEQRRVLTIKPGITGLSQISGRASLDFADEVRLDMHYIENWTPWTDLAILLKTPWIVIRKKGAY